MQVKTACCYRPPRDQIMVTKFLASRLDGVEMRRVTTAVARDFLDGVEG